MTNHSGGLCWSIWEELERNFALMAVVMLVSRVSAVNWLENEQLCLQGKVELALLIVRLKQDLQLLLESFPGMTVHIYPDVWQRL